MDELSSVEASAGPGGRRRLGKVVSALAIVSWVCVGGPAQRTLEPAPPQEMLATQIRAMTTGDVRPEQQEALRHIAVIEPAGASTGVPLADFGEPGVLTAIDTIAMA